MKRHSCANRPKRIDTVDWICRHRSEIEEWFNAETFDWYNNSWILARFCQDHFHVWFHKTKYNYKFDQYLAVYCINYIDYWYDPDIYIESKDELLLESIQ